MVIAFMLAGLVLGALLAGSMGGLLGTLIGTVGGMLLAGNRKATHPLPTGAGFHHELHELLCVPKGQVARTTFIRSDDTGEFLDIESCSLCRPEDHVRCSKRCLFLMRDEIPRRRPQSATRQPVAAGS